MPVPGAWSFFLGDQTPERWHRVQTTAPRTQHLPPLQLLLSAPGIRRERSRPARGAGKGRGSRTVKSSSIWRGTTTGPQPRQTEDRSIPPSNSPPIPGPTKGYELLGLAPSRACVTFCGARPETTTPRSSCAQSDPPSPRFLTGGTLHGSAIKRDSSFSREKRVHRLRLGSILTRKWDLGDAGSVAVYAPCLHS